MKKALYFLALTLLFSVSIGSATATVFRVNNSLTENIPNKLFSEIQTAIKHFSVVNGDTLMVEGSATAYGGFICDKRLVIIGPGYFLGDNPGINGVVTSAKTNSSCYFNTGSQGSYLIGMESDYAFNLSTSNIYVLRCKGPIFFNGNSSSPASNCTVKQSYCIYLGGYQNYSSNISITNCIIQQDQSNFNYLNYDNNILVGTSTWTFSAGTFRNNILVDRDVQSNISSPTKQNNLAPNQQFGNTNGNISYDPNNLFIGGTSSDGKYQIKATSTYIAAGYGGTQPGIFGGSEPYTLSGVPPIPIIYELNVPGTGSAATGLNINVKIRGAN